MATARVGVFGAGAIGCHLAGSFARAGMDVSVVARGATLSALRRDGVGIEDVDGSNFHAVSTSADAAELGPQDVVFIALKAHAVATTAPQWQSLLGPRTLVVFAQNGIPWWYEEHRGVTCDPLVRGSPVLARVLVDDQAIGAVVLSSCSVVSPGIVRNDSPGRNRLLVGEIDDAATSRIAGLRAMVRLAGFDSPDVPDLRRAVWRKLMLNLAGSSLCALTRRDVRVIADDPAIGDLFERLVREAMSIAAASGIKFDPAEIDPLAWRKANGSAHRPSMLVDLENGRPLETTAILGRPQALARAHGVDTPVLDTVLALLERAAADRAPEHE